MSRSNYNFHKELWNIATRKLTLRIEQSGSGMSGIVMLSGIINWLVSRSTKITSFGTESIFFWEKNDAGIPMINGVGAKSNWNL